VIIDCCFVGKLNVVKLEFMGYRRVSVIATVPVKFSRDCEIA
jgi:hypothetical protein